MSDKTFAILVCTLFSAGALLFLVGNILTLWRLVR